MSRPQEPHRPFFPFGNPFRMISPKGAHMSPRLLAILNAFEELLAERLKKLIPKQRDEVLSFSWMKAAMGSLCETHSDIKILITELELPVSEWDEKWIDVYLDISVKLLDLCIAFTSEISRLNQGRLMLQCALHKLESCTHKQFAQAQPSIDGWRQQLSSKNSRIENCSSILDKLVESLNLPKVKKLAKGKVLMRAMYGVKVFTIYVCSVFVAAFSGSAGKLFELPVAGAYLWAQAYTDLHTTLNQEIKLRYANGSSTILKELEVVDTVVNKLYPVIKDGVSNVEEEEFPSTIRDLCSGVHKLSQGLDLLAKEVDSFFQVVLTGRDALLSSLRADGTFSTLTSDHKINQRLIK